jgi:peptidoglycan biosynthesis protein MviN/MurJ (putative lipid II flippase)
MTALPACRRLLFSVALVTVWAMALSPQAVWLGVATLSGSCATIAAAIALFRREPLLGPSLNRWDEATALMGMHFLARALI